MPALVQLETEFRAAWSDDAFRAEYAGLLFSYAGRPTPVTDSSPNCQQGLSGPTGRSQLRSPC